MPRIGLTVLLALRRAELKEWNDAFDEWHRLHGG